MLENFKDDSLSFCDTVWNINLFPVSSGPHRKWLKMLILYFKLFPIGTRVDRCLKRDVRLFSQTIHIVPTIILEVGRKTSSLLATRSFLVILLLLLFFPDFCPADFSEVAGQIFLKLSGKMWYQLNSIPIFSFFDIYFRSANIAILLFLKSHFVQHFSRKR